MLLRGWGRVGVRKRGLVWNTSLGPCLRLPHSATSHLKGNPPPSQKKKPNLVTMVTASITLLHAVRSCVGPQRPPEPRLCLEAPALSPPPRSAQRLGPPTAAIRLPWRSPRNVRTALSTGLKFERGSLGRSLTALTEKTSLFLPECYLFLPARISVKPSGIHPFKVRKVTAHSAWAAVAFYFPAFDLISCGYINLMLNSQ